MTTFWTQVSIPEQDLDLCRLSDSQTQEPIPVSGDRWFWDFAPVLDADGVCYTIGEREVWLALTAPKSDDPSKRHFVASLAVLSFSNRKWHFLGELRLRGSHPGNREWAGMASVNQSTLTVYFTSAGMSGGAKGYQQRLWSASCPIGLLDNPGGSLPWTGCSEVVVAEAGPYLPADQEIGEPGKIRAFRDPFYFACGERRSEYLVFTATSAEVTSQYNGAIGLARNSRGNQGWEHVRPLIISEDVATELERPHVVVHGGLYYLFWSTPLYAFNPGSSYPTGLYGAVSERPDGSYRLLNNNGLVLANPVDRPFHQYSWFVSQDLSVQGFVDLPDYPSSRHGGGPPGAEEGFAGTAAPRYTVFLDGDRARVSSGPP